MSDINILWWVWHYCCCYSVIKSCPTFCNPINCSIFRLLHHYLPEFHETHIQWVSDDSNHLTLCCHFSSCPQFFTASGTFPLSQLFISGGQSFEASSVLPMNIQSWFLLGWLVRSPAVKGTLKSLLKVQKHQFFGAQPSLWPNSHIHTWLWKKT